MRSGVIALLCVLTSSTAALGQTVSSPARAETRYVGVVTGTDVYVRSKNNPEAYPCTKLSYPDRVTVVGKSPGWLKILPPAGTYSVISKQYVQLDASGKVGRVSGNNVWVRAAGRLRNSNFYIQQTQLSSGDKVQVFGEVDAYYKIVSPAGVCFYISDRYVKPADQVGDRPAHRPDAPPTETQPTPTTTTAPTTAPAEPQTESAKAIEEFHALEAALMAEFSKAPERRDLKGILARYKAFRISPDSRLKPYLDYSIKYLEAAIQRRNQRSIYDNLLKKAARDRKDYETSRAQLELKTTEQQKALYDAQGVLAPSAIYTGGATGPKRYVLRDANTAAIVAYAEPTPQEPNLAAYVDKHVGVLGIVRYDAEILADIIRVQEVIVIAEKVSLPKPPEPVIGPMPTAPPAAEQPAEPPAPVEPVEEKPIETPAPVEPVEEKPVETPAPVEPVEEKPAETPAPVEPVEEKPAETPAPVEEKPAETKAPPVEVKPIETKPVEIEQPKPVIKPWPLEQPEPKPAPVIEIKPEPVVTPEPKPAPIIEIKLEPVVTPEPKPAPVVEVTLEPVVTPEPKPAPIIEIKPEPVVTPEPKPAPIIEIKPEPVVEVTLEPVVTPEPKPAPIIEIKPEPVVTPVIEIKPVPVVEVKLDPVVTPVIEIKPEPVIEVKPEPKPVAVSKPLPYSQLPVLKPATAPADEPLEEEEYD